MAMARHAPHDQYTRALGITDHAIERLRQRLDKTSMANTTHRSDADLGNMIDQATVDAFHRSDYENEMDDGVPLRIARMVQLPTTEPLYALVKPNNAAEAARHKSMPFVVVTLYTKLMVDKARSSGRWAWGRGEGSTVVQNPGRLDAKKTSQLVEKLSGFGSKLQIALELAEMKGEPIVPVAPISRNDLVKNTHRAAAASTPAPPIPAAPAPAARPQAQPVAASATEMCLVTYCHEDEDDTRFNGQMQVAEFQRIELKQRLGELHSDKRIDKSTIRVWREMKATVRVRVEVDIDE